MCVCLCARVCFLSAQFVPNLSFQSRLSPAAAPCPLSPASNQNQCSEGSPKKGKKRCKIGWNHLPPSPLLCRSAVKGTAQSSSHRACLGVCRKSEENCLAKGGGGRPAPLPGGAPFSTGQGTGASSKKGPFRCVCGDGNGGGPPESLYCVEKYSVKMFISVCVCV